MIISSYIPFLSCNHYRSFNVNWWLQCALGRGVSRDRVYKPANLLFSILCVIRVRGYENMMVSSHLRSAAQCRWFADPSGKLCIYHAKEEESDITLVRRGVDRYRERSHSLKPRLCCRFDSHSTRGAVTSVSVKVVENPTAGKILLELFYSKTCSR